MVDKKLQTYLLDRISDELCKLGFTNYRHCRLSIEPIAQVPVNNMTKSNQHLFSYQGLSHAMLNEKKVMLKWQLMVDKSACFSTLAQEALNLKYISEVYKQQNTLRTVVPLLGFYEHHLLGQVEALVEQSWQFSVLCMPFFRLGSIKHYLATRTLGKSQKIELILAVARSLSSLHQIGWCHGDIKPSNCLVSLSDKSQQMKQAQFNTKPINHLKVWLTDLACAKQPTHFLGSCYYPLNQNLRRLSDLPLQHIEFNFHNKRASQINGTPAYVAPECWHGQEISVQSDIYAFGVLMYEVLCGNKPFNISSADKEMNDTARTWAHLHCQAPIPMLKKDDAELQFIMNKLLAKNVAQRYNTMQEVIAEIEKVVSI